MARTNDIGQDIFSELLYGTRTSLAVGACSAAISMALGTAVGMTAGWFGGCGRPGSYETHRLFHDHSLSSGNYHPQRLYKAGALDTSVILGVMSWSGTAPGGSV